MKVELYLQSEEGKGYEESFFKELDLPVIPQVGWSFCYADEDTFAQLGAGVAEVLDIVYDIREGGKIRILIFDQDASFADLEHALPEDWRLVPGWV